MNRGTGGSGSKTDPSYEAAQKVIEKVWREHHGSESPIFEDIKREIEDHYLKMISRVTAQDVAFVLDKRADRAILNFEKGALDWAAPLGKQMRLFLRILRDSMSGECELHWKNMTALTAALQYLMNPANLIPDSTQGIGLVDDALVIAKCVSMVGKDLRRYIKEQELDPAEFGL